MTGDRPVMVVDLPHGGYRHEHRVLHCGHHLAVHLITDVDVRRPNSNKKFYFE